MKFIKLTQGYSVKVDDDKFSELLEHEWCAQKVGDRVYSVTTIGDKKIYMGRYLLSAPQGTSVTYLNGDTLDCRLENLRAIKGTPRVSSGVIVTPTGNFRVDFCGKYLGTFSKRDAATMRRDFEAYKLYGDDAITTYAEEDIDLAHVERCRLKRKGNPANFKKTSDVDPFYEGPVSKKHRTEFQGVRRIARDRFYARIGRKNIGPYLTARACAIAREAYLRAYCPNAPNRDLANDELDRTYARSMIIESGSVLRPSSLHPNVFEVLRKEYWSCQTTRFIGVPQYVGRFVSEQEAIDHFDKIEETVKGVN